MFRTIMKCFVYLYSALLIIGFVVSVASGYRTGFDLMAVIYGTVAAVLVYTEKTTE